MIRTRTIIAFCAIVAFASLNKSVNAALLLWTIDNPLVLDSGATITGSFVYDADANEYSSLELVAGDSSTDGLYDVITPTRNATGFRAVMDEGGPLIGEIAFTLLFVDALTNSGGNVSVSFVALGMCDDNACAGFTSHPDDQASIFNGDIGTLIASPIPLPPALPLMTVALAGVAFVSWRRNGAFNPRTFAS